MMPVDTFLRGDGKKTMTLIVLNWNGGDVTVKCLESIRLGTYSACNVIVVDNGSTDGSLDRIRSRFPEVHVIENHKNLGYAGGNNPGIREALRLGSEFIGILNNDTALEVGTLQNIVEIAEKFPEAGIYSPLVYSLNQPEVCQYSGFSWNAKQRRFDFLPLSEKADVWESDFGIGCALFFHRRVAEKIGLFDSRFFLTWEEVDWCFRARRSGFSIKVCPLARVWHLGSHSFDGGDQGPVYQYYSSRNRMLWVEKNFTGLERLRLFWHFSRGAYYGWRDLRAGSPSSEMQALIRVRLRGFRDYVMRRFEGVSADELKAVAAGIS